MVKKRFLFLWKQLSNINFCENICCQIIINFFSYIFFNKLSTNYSIKKNINPKQTFFLEINIPIQIDSCIIPTHTHPHTHAHTI